MSNKGRNFPQLMVTIYPRQMDRLTGMHRGSGLSLSRIVREALEYAFKRGYTPGSVSLGDMRDSAHASIED